MWEYMYVIGDTTSSNIHCNFMVGSFFFHNWFIFIGYDINKLEITNIP